MTAYVAGVDGCAAGWLVALRPLAHAAPVHLLVVPSFDEVLRLELRPQIVAVDMPIGLPDLGAAGGRACDVAARSVLGARQSSVFAVPARAAVMCQSYARACEVALARSQPPRKVSKQTFHLFAKIREVDALMTPQLQSRVVECHPEAAFWAMNARVALAEPKKAKSRPFAPGLALRRSLLAAAGYDAGRLADPPPSGADPDDVLDAMACAWTAARIAVGAAVRFPVSPSVDARGLRMEIWA